jgi:hypothetical protein
MTIGTVTGAAVAAAVQIGVKIEGLCFRDDRHKSQGENAGKNRAKNRSF